MTFRILIIDPERCKVEETQSPATLADLHQLVGKPSLDSFRIAEHDDSFDYGWADDVGLVDGQPVYAFKFQGRGRTDPIAGRCVIIGVDKESRDNCDAAMPVDFLHAVVVWLGRIKPQVTWVKEINGARAVVTYERVQ